MGVTSGENTIMKKYLLLSTAALAAIAFTTAGLAADLPVKAPVMPPPPPLFSWTGFYLGGNIGAAWGHRDVTDLTRGLAFTQSSNGRFIGGGQIGYNWQFNNFVIGAEADADWLSHNNNSGTGIIVPGVGTIVASSNSTWISTAAARFGIANDHWLFYGKAGGGWVGTSNLTVTNLTTGRSITGTNSGTSSGFLVGGGVEYAITNNWTVKAEYDYLGLSRRTFIVPVGSPFFIGDNFRSGGRNVQMAKIGFNYLFNASGFLQR
jgi:outer membrane immunogenic protein